MNSIHDSTDLCEADQATLNDIVAAECIISVTLHYVFVAEKTFALFGKDFAFLGVLVIEY